jgi:hypothetical protein
MNLTKVKLARTHTDVWDVRAECAWHLLILQKEKILGYSGSKFRGSRLPWRDLMYVSCTIVLNARPGVSM